MPLPTRVMVGLKVAIATSSFLSSDHRFLFVEWVSHITSTDSATILIPEIDGTKKKRSIYMYSRTESCPEARSSI